MALVSAGGEREHPDGKIIITTIINGPWMRDLAVGVRIMCNNIITHLILSNNNIININFLQNQLHSCRMLVLLLAVKMPRLLALVIISNNHNNHHHTIKEAATTPEAEDLNETEEPEEIIQSAAFPEAVIDTEAQASAHPVVQEEGAHTVHHEVIIIEEDIIHLEEDDTVAGVEVPGEEAIVRMMIYLWIAVDVQVGDMD